MAVPHNKAKERYSTPDIITVIIGEEVALPATINPQNGNPDERTPVERVADLLEHASGMEVKRQTKRKTIGDLLKENPLAAEIARVTLRHQFSNLGNLNLPEGISPGTEDAQKWANGFSPNFRVVRPANEDEIHQAIKNLDEGVVRGQPYAQRFKPTPGAAKPGRA